MLESQTGHVVQQVADQVIKSQGTVPGEFTEILARLSQLNPPEFDWKGFMRRFLGKS